MNDILSRLEETKAYIRRYTTMKPAIGIILGSGLGHIASQLHRAIDISYDDLPHVVPSTVQGHAGSLVFGMFADRDVVVMQGRHHYYEGYTMQEITYPVRLLKHLGVERLIVTAAVGAMNPSYKRSDLVVLKDHINLMGDTPLRGTALFDALQRFPDMSKVYSPRLSSLAVSVARALGLRVHEGIYVGVTGPCYETPAEVAAYRMLGGDVVGMSVIPETIVANQLGLEIVGLTYVSNMAAGIAKKTVSHAEVLRMGELINRKLGSLIEGIIKAS